MFKLDKYKKYFKYANHFNILIILFAFKQTFIRNCVRFYKAIKGVIWK